MASQDLQHEPYVGESRRRVLETLQAADEPLGVGDVAGLVGLHPNTARFHLDALTESALAERTREERDVPGRPRWLYTAGPASIGTGRRSYQLLAQILSSYLTSHTPHPGRAALEAGEAWGHFLVERPRPFTKTDEDTATTTLVKTLDELGFAPERSDEVRDRKVLLHHCPFLEAAKENQEVVCAVHLGLMRGALGELNTSLTADRLDPLVTPSLCVTHLSGQAVPA
ncbi:helix-turn-helix transcriptional regulator [Leekyejoonella antrihumi]|uniref:ArsR family transcriptional regulator n=1 Tax=Leekyejoonella antrihumi TaxID=1660198 RepID=A0A563E2A7_9MICO|nr:helix-turn-helix domain-containing protein [Leekyejoonella antrihumi]TWP36678.1 ArsR family transcriptional regulator [Leekyejoonella antrihumi]